MMYKNIEIHIDLSSIEESSIRSFDLKQSHLELFFAVVFIIILLFSSINQYFEM